MVDTKTSLTIGGATFYFPQCRITRTMVKNPFLFEVPPDPVTGAAGAMGFDVLLQSQNFRVIGTWKNDTAGEYDSLTAVARQDAFFAAMATEAGGATLTWIGTAQTVIGKELVVEQEDGGKRFLYNFVFEVARIPGV